MTNYNFLKTRTYGSAGRMAGNAAIAADGSIYFPMSLNESLWIQTITNGVPGTAYETSTPDGSHLTADNGIIFYKHGNTIYRYDTSTKATTSRGLGVRSIISVNVYQGNLIVGITSSSDGSIEFWTLNDTDLSTISTDKLSDGGPMDFDPGPLNGVILGSTIYFYTYYGSGVLDIWTFTIGSTTMNHVSSNFDAKLGEIKSNGELDRVGQSHLAVVNGKISGILMLYPDSSNSLSADQRMQMWYCNDILDGSSPWQEYSTNVMYVFNAGSSTCNFFYSLLGPGESMDGGPLAISDIGSSAASNLDSLDAEEFTVESLTVKNVYPSIDIQNITSKVIIGEDVNNAGQYYFMYYDDENPGNSTYYPSKEPYYSKKPTPIVNGDNTWAVFAHGEKLEYSSIGGTGLTEISSKANPADSDWLVPVQGGGPNRIQCITNNGLLYDVEIQEDYTFNITPYTNLDAPGNIHPFTDGTYLYIYSQGALNFNIYKFGEYGTPFATTAVAAVWPMTSPPTTVPQVSVIGNVVHVVYGYKNTGPILSYVIDKTAIDAGNQNIAIPMKSIFMQEVTNS